MKNYTRYFLYPIVFYAIISFLVSEIILLNQLLNPPYLTLKKTADKPEVLGQYNQPPRIYISSKEDGFGKGGLIALASTDEPAVEIGSYDTSGEAEINVYEANDDLMLDYLLHDKDNNQLKKTFDVSNLHKTITIKQKITKSYDQGSKVLLPIGESGIWFLQVNLNKAIVYGMVMRSPIGTIAKEGDNELIFWSQNFKSRRSLTEGTVKIFNLFNNKNELASASINTDGIAKTAISAEADVAVVYQGDSRAIVPLNLEYLNSSYRYEIFKAKKSESKYFIFTDRTVYQPGDTIYFKAFLRNDEDARYSIPSGNATVKVYKDWDEKNSIFAKGYAISSSGGVSGDVSIPKDVPTGDYQLKVSFGDENQTFWRENYIPFQIQYFRKPEYSLEIEMPVREYIAKDKVSFTIHGAYFSGQPLAEQNIKYTIYSSDYYQYEYNYQVPPPGDEYRYGFWASNKIQTGNSKLDEDGQGVVNLNIFTNGQNQIYSIEAQIDDGSGNPAFARRNILVYAGEFEIYRKDSKYSVKINNPLKLPLVLVPRRSASVASIQLNAKIHRENWISYQNPNEKYTSFRKEEENLPDLTTTTDKNGEAVIQFIPTKVGSYTIKVSGKDALGNFITKSFSAWVSSIDEPVYSDQYGTDLVVKSDKENYNPNDTVDLSIASTVPDRDVFLSLERGRVNRFQIIHINGKTASVQIPLVDTDAPNIFARALSFSSYSLDDASTNLIVSPEAKRLRVQIFSDKKTYKPGENVILNVETTDKAGNPVGAETALWAVDKAIFELIDGKPSNIFDKFWSERGDSTVGSHSLMGISAYDRGGMGGGGGGGGGRSIFKDTAYWNPTIQTDSSGKAQVNFKLPDNLTTWVIAAISATQDTRVGQTSDEIVVSKDVIVRPTLPNLLRIGDKIKLTALVQNFTNSDDNFEVNLIADDLQIQSSTSSAVLIAAKKSIRLAWDVNPKQENEKAKLTFLAKSLEHPSNTDQVTVEIPIIPFGFWDKIAEVGDGSKKFNLQLGKDSDLDKSKINLTLSSTIVGSLPTAMQYLLDYPYGCVEQTTSRFVPAVIAKLNPDLFAKSFADKDIAGILKKGVDRLKELQHNDGGWTWWYSGNSDSFITAYVVEYLVEAKKIGVKVDDEILKRAKDFLEININGVPAEELIAKVYGLSILGSDKGKKFIKTTGINLSPDFLSLAVLANIQNSFKDPQTNGLSKLLSMAKKQGEGIFWNEGTKLHFGSIDASTSFAIRAVLQAGGDREIATKAVRYLLRSRKYEYWSNTFATAQVIRALVDFSKTGQELTPNYSYSVLLDGKTIRTGDVSLSSKDIPEILIDPRQIKPDGSVLEIVKSGEGQLYSTVVIKEFHTDKNAKAVSNGIIVKRDYRNDISGNNLMGVGDIVTVTLTLSGLKANELYAVIEDELPAGLVPINPIFKNEQGNIQYQGYYSNYAASEITRNGIILSAYSVNSTGNYYTYKARVVSEGEFLVPPTTASLMYAPEIYGRSSAQKVIVSAQKQTAAQKPFIFVTPQGPTSQFKSSSKQIYLTIEAVLIVVLIILLYLRKRDIVKEKEKTTQTS